MVDRDVVTAKVATIDRCLQRISETRGERSAVLLPVEVEDIRRPESPASVQAAIDLATHVVSAKGMRFPDSVAAFFSVLEGHGILEPAPPAPPSPAGERLTPDGRVPEASRSTTYQALGFGASGEAIVSATSPTFACFARPSGRPYSRV
jgi:hypothetical protein